MSLSRRFWKARGAIGVVVALGVGLGVLSSVTGSASAASPTPSAALPPPIRAISWLAAGDLYSSGQGLVYELGPCAQAQASQGEPGAWGIEAAHDLSGAGKISLARGSPDLVACTAATTANFTHSQGKLPPQWSIADPRYDLVTFTFGGDDLNFKSVIEACLGLDPAGIISGVGLLSSPLARALALKAWELDPFAHCQSNSTLRSLIAQLAGPYKEFLEGVSRQAVTPGGNILVLGYPELVEDPKLWSGIDKDIGLCQGITPADAEELRGLAGDLNATIAETVASVDAEGIDGVHLRYVDVNTGTRVRTFPIATNTFSNRTRDRGIISVPLGEWINGITLRNGHGTDLASYFSSSFHPNQEGNDAMAALVDQVFPQLDWSHLAATPTLGQLWAPDQLGTDRWRPR